VLPYTGVLVVGGYKLSREGTDLRSLQGGVGCLSEVCVRRSEVCVRLSEVCVRRP
jgi:hypothetical protein